MAEGNVCVSPGMFETKVIVAPNSPVALANERIIPAIMPGRIRGRVTTRKTRGGDAPSVPAASSNLRSTASIERRTARTRRGKPLARPVNIAAEVLGGQQRIARLFRNEDGARPRWACVLPQRARRR